MEKVNFDCIAGYKEEKERLISIANAFKHKDKLKKMGAKLPRGLLLLGENGLGKTKLAEAFMNLANVNVVTINTNDDKEDDKLKDYLSKKFEEAKSKLPCIIYIDEVDKIAGCPENFMIEDNNNKSRILLNELNKNTNINGLFLLMIANTRYELDPSIFRSGRVDYVISIERPTVKERKEIIAHYIKNIAHDKNLNIDEIARTFVYATGADIESIINNAAINVVNKENAVVTTKELYKAFLNKRFSTEGKIKSEDEKDLKITAIHETGHAVVDYILTGDIPDVLSIESRSDSLGFMSKCDDGKQNISYTHLLNRIQTLLAGKAAERYYLKEMTLGSYDDLTKARKNITKLVRVYGYSGTQYMNTGEKEDMMPPSGYVMSESRLKEIEIQEDIIFNNLSNKVDSIIKNNGKLIKSLSEELFKRKIIFKKELQDIFTQQKNIL